MEAAYSSERLLSIYKTTQSHSLDGHRLKATWVRVARELSVSPKVAQNGFRGWELTQKIKCIHKRENGNELGILKVLASHTPSWTASRHIVPPNSWLIRHIHQMFLFSRLHIIHFIPIAYILFASHKHSRTPEITKHPWDACGKYYLNKNKQIIFAFLCVFFSVPKGMPSFYCYNENFPIHWLNSARSSCNRREMSSGLRNLSYMGVATLMGFFSPY
jgi:hypothetical protein